MTLASIDWLNLAAILLFFVGVMLSVKARAGVRSRLNQRLTDAAQGRSAASRISAPRGAMAALGRGLQAMGKLVPVFNAAQRNEMSKKLVSAGYRQPGALPLLMGLAAGMALLIIVLIVLVAWPLMGSGNALMRSLSLFVGGYLGLLLPRLVLDRLVARRQRAITRHFPDALDLMVVCVNSGLGLNAALQRVAHEMAFLAPELADELALTAGQLQLSGDTTEVLHGLAERIGLASISSLVSTLIQSRQFGTPIGEALRVLSASERTARLMRTEEAAAKLATKITVPMMLFILPTVLIVSGGPSVLHMMSAFGK
ncbi:type II secretion system F family protein [Parapusillimonas sp. SGNA-6]|nr:type II secretion system F family protein [Parapusillimonas sp. SGNA-6]